MNIAINHWHCGQRQTTLAQLSNTDLPWDIVVVGGGITGAGVILEAAKRGLKCLLLEQQDFSWGTSSRSSKMVHGGLRYLASGAFGLTRDAVQERQRLLDEAPGLVENLHFFMPHYKGDFPGPKLFNKVMTLYDFMAGKQNHEFYPAKDSWRWISGLRQENLLGATRFADAVVDDARLVLRVLSEAQEQGGLAVNYLKVMSVANPTENTKNSLINLQLQDQLSQQTFTIQAKTVVNATGAWTDELRALLGAQAVIRPLRGSHLIIPNWRLPVACSLSFPHPQDKRPVFIFPWEGVTVIGTTDLDHKENINKEAAITPAEIDYLLDAVNHALPDSQLVAADIQATIAGVRPVVGGTAKDPSKEKREHVIWDDGAMISVAGGKLTTFRLIALDVLNIAAKYLPDAAKNADSRVFKVLTHTRPQNLTQKQWLRLSGHYGQHATRISQLSAKPVANTDTLWGELIWAVGHESVQHLDDLLLRRTRLGLLLSQGGLQLKDELETLCQQQLSWDAQQFEQEWQRYLKIWQEYYSCPL